MRFVVLFGLYVCTASAGNCVLPVGAVLRVTLAPQSPRSLKANTPMEGTIDRPVYHASCRLLPAGVAAKASANGVSTRVELMPPGLNPIVVRATVIRVSKERRSAAGLKPERASRMLLLRVEEATDVPGSVEIPSTGSGVIAAGVQVRVALQSKHNSKTSPKADAATARLLEPLIIDGKVLLPEGTLVNGTLSQAGRARRLYRAGSLRISFHSMQVDSSQAVNTPLTLVSGQVAGGSRIDGEGAITGSALTKKRALINLGISYVVGKILDDVIEEGAKSIYGIAAAGSAETAARYVGLGAGLAVFLLHRGREVKVEPQTELVLTFSRAVEISK